MPNYYEMKRDMYRLVDEMLKEGKTDNEIVLKAQTRYGFGERPIKERIDLVRAVQMQQ